MFVFLCSSTLFVVSSTVQLTSSLGKSGKKGKAYNPISAVLLLSTRVGRYYRLNTLQEKGVNYTFISPFTTLQGNIKPEKAANIF